MKRKIVCLIIAAVASLSFVGCSKQYENPAPSDNEAASAEVGDRIGRFVILEDEGKYIDEFCTIHHQYLAYDKDTYIVYVYDISSGVSISPYYCMDINNEPVISVYYDGIWE